MQTKTWIRVTLLCFTLILMILMIFGGLQLLETAFFSESGQEVIATKTIVKDGVEYYPRNDICVVLIMGIDQEGKVIPSEEPNHGNAVDMVTLLVFDEQDETISLLAINRDTMVEMPRLNDQGRETGTRVAQLALSHTYGHGAEDSCINTRTTVSNLLNGITIDYYWAMNMDVVAILNDAVGGVTVTVRDDFSQVDSSIQMGEMTLRGEQALVYTQSRQNVGDQLSVSRVERQKDYMRGFIQALKENAPHSNSFALEVYDEVSDYVVSDMTSSVISRLLSDYEHYTLSEAYTLEGENIRTETYYEYYPDQAALDELTLKLFYKEKE